MGRDLPGKGFMGWLGRQVGYVRSALRKDPAGTTVYRNKDVQEMRPTNEANVTLRRTTVEEIIVKPPEE